VNVVTRAKENGRDGRGGLEKDNGRDRGAGNAPDALTIEDLAQRTRMSVRNIRAHQSRGLLPPPEIQGRTGYYGEGHVARLQLISEMQSDGFNLQAIKRMLEASGGAVEEVLDFKRALMVPFEDEEPELIDRTELESRWGGPLDPKLMRRAEKLRLVRPLGGDRYEIPSPSLYRAGEQVLALGVPIETVFTVAERVRRHSEAIAQSFVELFLEGVWKPFVAAGRPDDDWPRVRDALERLRPLASEAVVASFRTAMTEAVEKAFGKELDRR
jgi:DNA-binding transcriptional MerR regulator